MIKSHGSIVIGLIVAFCLIWIAGVSWAVVHYLNLSDPVGWWIAASLGFSLLVSLAVIKHGVEHAVESESTDCDGVEEPAGFGSLSISRVSPKQFSEF